MMKKGLLFITFLVVLVFLVGCTSTEEITDEELELALEELSDAELEELSNLPEESGALAGEAITSRKLSKTLESKVNKFSSVKSSYLKTKVRTLLKARQAISISETEAPSALEVYFPDPELAKEIQEEVGDILTPEIVNTITILNADRNDVAIKIMELTGMEQIGQLEALYLQENSINDLTPLIQNENLRVLNIDNNNVEVFTPLTNHPAIEEVFARNNDLVGMSGIETNEQLTKLILKNNEIQFLPQNANLPLLRHLDLSSNNILNIYALGNWGMSNLLTLDLRGNPLSQRACDTLHETGPNSFTTQVMAPGHYPRHSCSE
jgi:hypothetical protein